MTERALAPKPVPAKHQFCSRELLVRENLGMRVSGALPSCLCPNEAGHPKDAF
jgi:hypothetical protein